MNKTIKLKKWFISLLAVLSILASVISPFATIANAQSIMPEEPTGDLTEYATNKVGATDQGWAIYTSEETSDNPMDRAAASTGARVSKSYGGVTSHTSIVTVIDDQGQSHIAYCVEPHKDTPNGDEYNQMMANNDRLRTVLYYGYGGVDSAEFMALEGGNVNNAYMDTWIAARIAYGSPVENPAWVQDPCVSWLLNHATIQFENITCTGSPETTWNESEFRQETSWYNVTGNTSSYTLHLDGTGIYAILSDGRTINSTTSDIPTGTSFMLCAGPEKDGSVTVEVKGPGKAYAGMVFIPKLNDSVQTIVSGGLWVDPIQNTKAIANFKPRKQDVKPSKADAIRLDQVDADYYKPMGDASLDGAVFGLYKNKECTDKVAEATAKDCKLEFGQIVLGTYYLKEIKPGEGYTLNPEVYEIKLKSPDGTFETDLPNKVIMGKVNLKKYAIPSDWQSGTETGDLNPLANVDFSLTLKSALDNNKELIEGENLFTGKTNDAGELAWDNVPFGTYILKETKTPDGFKPIKDRIIQITKDGETIELVLSNQEMYGELSIVKKDAESGKVVPVAGAEFKVIDLSDIYNPTFVKQSSAATLFIPKDTFKTDKTGKVGLLKPLKAGDYALVEVKAPEGYEIFGLTTTDAYQTYTVDGKEYKGIPFTISAENCDKVESDGQTVYALEQSLSNQPSKGRIRVEKTGEMVNGYTTSDTEFGKLYTFNYEQKNLAGCVFDIIAEEDIVTPDGTVKATAGSKVATITTNDKGLAESGDLYLGKYIVKEVSAPDGYVIDETEHKVEIKYVDDSTKPENNIEVIKVEDDKQNMDFTLNKTEEQFEGFETDEDNNLTVIKKEVKANDITFGVYTAAPIQDGKGGIVPADSLVYLGTVKDGQIVTSGEFPFGQYYYKELKSKDTLVPDMAKSDVITFAPDKNVPMVHFTAQQTITDENGNQTVTDQFKNYLATTKWEFSKTEVSTGKPLPNTETTIYDADKNVIWKGVTDENGKITIPELPVGKYYYQETKAPEGYLCDDTLYPFEVTNKDTFIKAEMTDELAMGNIEIEKKGEDRGHFEVKDGETIYEVISMEDCEFAVKATEDIITPEGVVRAVKGDTVAHIITDKDGKATVTEAYFMTAVGAEERVGLGEVTPMDLTTLKVDTEKPEENKPEESAMAKPVFEVAKLENLYLGKYDIVETKAPEGYELDSKIYTVSLEYVDDRTPVVKVDPVKPFNMASKGDFELTKTDVSTGNTLPGAGITIYDSNKNEIFKGKTDDSGKITITKLPTGKYYFQEYGSPEGYELDNTLFEFEIKENGEVVKCQMTNKPIPNTGILSDNNNTVIYLFVGAMLLTSALVAKTYKARSGK